MTSATQLLRAPDIDVRELPSNCDLVDALRQVSRDVNRRTPWSWTLSYLREDLPWFQQPALLVGIRDAATGALAWEDQPPLIPCGGSNPEPVDYWLAGIHHTPMSPHTEVPTHVVLHAIDEFIRTGQRPTCVNWQPEV